MNAQRVPASGFGQPVQSSCGPEFEAINVVNNCGACNPAMRGFHLKGGARPRLHHVVYLSNIYPKDGSCENQPKGYAADLVAVLVVVAGFDPSTPLVPNEVRYHL
jgi:hypothetical protein